MLICVAIRVTLFICHHDIYFVLVFSHHANWMMRNINSAQSMRNVCTVVVVVVCVSVSEDLKESGQMECELVDWPVGNLKPHNY